MEARKGSRNSSRASQGLGFATTIDSCDVTRYNASKNLKETRSAPVLDCTQTRKLLDSARSKKKALAHKLKASKIYLKSLFSKVSNTRAANEHHFQNNLLARRERYDGEDVAMASRSNHRENSDAIHSWPSSKNFCFIKGSTLIPKPNSKPFKLNRASAYHSAAHLGRKMISSNSEQDNAIEAAIAHCKQSLSGI